MKLSAQEKRLVNFARKEFGEELVEFLMAGSGEDVTAQRWHFTITYAGNGNSLLTQRVEVITYEPEDGSSYLPCRRDPLVLFALLHFLLLSSDVASNTLRYQRGDLLSLLGRKD